MSKNARSFRGGNSLSARRTVARIGARPDHAPRRARQPRITLRRANRSRQRRLLQLGECLHPANRADRRGQRRRDLGQGRHPQTRRSPRSHFPTQERRGALRRLRRDGDGPRPAQLATNVTILSGDIDNNDLNTDGNFIADTPADIQGTNSYHVARSSAVSARPWMASPSPPGRPMASTPMTTAAAGCTTTPAARR